MRSRPVGLSLAAWSFSFAGVHVAWALGWRGGVPDDAPPISARPWFLAYDLLAALLMYVAAGVALHLARGGLPHRTRERLRLVTLAGSLTALARGVPALGWDVATGEVTGVGFGADVWFVVAGCLGLALWLSVRGHAGRPAGGVGRDQAERARDHELITTIRRLVR